MKHLFQPAALGAALILTTTLAAEAAFTTKPGPAVIGSGPTTTTDNGHTTSPGDPFFPPVTNAPTSNPDLATYPKLTCYFEIVDGQVVIHWFNKGTAAAPAGSMITGTTSGGIGVSWFITEAIEPGASITMTVDMNPAWFNDFCYATVTV